MSQSPWRGWDGTRLSWDGRGNAAQLWIDGVRFEHLHAASADEREFAFSPSGCAELEFSLHDAQGMALGAPWRVLHGVGTQPGVDQWQGPAHAMRALPEAPAMPRDALAACTAIIVPIYNSPQLVQCCIEAVLRWTHVPAR